jgi:hypothetical protein
MAEGIPARLSRQDARRFGLLVGGAFVALAIVLRWRGRLVPAELLGALGATLIVAGILVPNLLPPVHRVWMIAATGLSRVTTPIFMGAVYFGVFTPIGFVRRAFGHSALKSRRRGSSFWISRDPAGRPPKDMERQF